MVYDFTLSKHVVMKTLVPGDVFVSMRGLCVILSVTDVSDDFGAITEINMFVTNEKIVETQQFYDDETWRGLKLK